VIGGIWRQRRIPNWRAAADEDGHYCFAVALWWSDPTRAAIGLSATPSDLALRLDRRWPVISGRPTDGPGRENRPGEAAWSRGGLDFALHKPTNVAHGDGETAKSRLAELE